MRLLALWAFASPWFLLWGAAAAVPILIHLWSRRRYVETPWAATQFLLAAVRRHQRRMQIEQWILLAVRVCVLLLLAIALAEPVVSGLTGIRLNVRQPATHTILVIDTSYSMAYETENTTRLDAAQSLARQVVEDAASGDTFSLVTLSDPPEVIIGEPSASHRSVLDEISRLQIANTGADLNATLQHVERLVADDESDQRRIHLFSDLGETTWNASPTNDWRTRIDSLTRRASLRLSPVASTRDANNLAITRIALATRRVNVGESTSVEVQLANFGTRPHLRQRVQLSVDGQRQAEQFVDLRSGELAMATFDVTFDVAGEHVLEASMSGDRLPLDNRRWMIVSVRDATRVLCVQGRPHAAEYVALALQSAGDINTFQTEVASEHAILDRALNDYDCIFLCNVARFTLHEAERLQQYVEQGGGLVFTLGDIVQTTLYNDRFVNESSTHLIPATLGNIVGDERHHFDPLEYRHAITQPFRGHERSGMLTAPTWRFVRLTAVNETATVALAFDTGDPAIVEWKVGQGRVVLVATAVSPESLDRETDPPTPWTALASWPSFPPLVHEIANFVADDRVANHNVSIGDTLTGRIPSAAINADYQLTTPDDSQTPIRFGKDEHMWTYADTKQPGVYRASGDDASFAGEAFAVNLRTGESDLSEVSRDSLSAFFDTRTPFETRPSAPLQNEVPLFPLVLGALLVMLVAETFLATRFGRVAR